MKIRCLIAAIAFVLAVPVGAEAQDQFYHGSIGISSPSFSNDADMIWGGGTGYGLTIGFSQDLTSYFGVRGDVGVDYFSADWAEYLNAPSVEGGNLTAISGIVSAVLSLPTPTVRPYATAGFGYINYSLSDLSDAQGNTLTFEDLENQFAFSFGGGLQYAVSGQSRIFAEAMYLVGGEDVAFIPLRIGVSFGG